MGAPDDSERFVQFETGDLTIYVERGLLEKLEPEAQQMPFYIDCYGRFWLVFVEPWGDVEERDNSAEGRWYLWHTKN